MLIVFIISIAIFTFDFEKEKYFQHVKTLIILMFLGVTMRHFYNLQGNSLEALDFGKVPLATENFGMVVGICAFSYS